MHALFAAKGAEVPIVHQARRKRSTSLRKQVIQALRGNGMQPIWEPWRPGALTNVHFEIASPNRYVLPDL
jgi:hypothetical protein